MLMKMLGVITFYEGMFSLDSKTFRLVAVHELAHRWDEVTGSDLTEGLVDATDGWTIDVCFTAWCYDQGDVKNRPSEYSGDTAYEDFAESVTHTIYGETAQNRGGNPTYKGSARDVYVNAKLKSW